MLYPSSRKSSKKTVASAEASETVTSKAEITKTEVPKANATNIFFANREVQGRRRERRRSVAYYLCCRDMRGHFPIFSALLCGLQGHFVTGLGSSDHESEGLFQRYEAEFNNVESVCFTYLTTYFVQVEPTPGPGPEPEDPRYDGEVVTTTTQYPTGTERTGTVLIKVPTGKYMTRTEPWTGVATSTTIVPPAGTAPGTVIVLTPTPNPTPGYVTTTEPWTGSSTSTATVAPTGTVSGTVIILTPGSGFGYATTTEPWTGTVTSTTTVSPAGTTFGTVIILTPDPGPGYVTTTEGWTGAGTTTTVPPTGPGYVTTTELWTGTATSTTTVPPAGTTSGTVIIYTPPGYVTTTTTWRSSITSTTTVPPSGTQNGTVIVQVPYGATTIYTTQYNGSVTTTTTQFPTGTDATVTVVVQTPLPTLSCDPFGYLTQNTSLYRVNITSGDLTLIRDVVGDGRLLQAIGYNVADNYLYGTIGGRNNTPVFLIRIAANGDSTILNELTLPYRVNTGDVDEQSRYWITYNGTNITQVDVRPSSPTFGQLIGTTRRATTLPANNATIYDWAYVPGRGNFLWSLGQSPARNSTTLQRFNRGTYNWEFVREFGNIAGENWWGAIYASADGFLYATENSSGQIWRFPLSDIDGPPTRFSTANPTRENDGARCIRAQDLPDQPYATSP
ncbi:hypothetical protein DL768_010438 [Monosporascus sp. mg162]|nr:hypothetical protein DL768_010438 [Monosporascus sp. mg162]